MAMLLSTFRGVHRYLSESLVVNPNHSMHGKWIMVNQHTINDVIFKDKTLKTQDFSPFSQCEGKILMMNIKLKVLKSTH